jgi:hypothetical protein
MGIGGGGSDIGDGKDGSGGGSGGVPGGRGGWGPAVSDGTGDDRSDKAECGEQHGIADNLSVHSTLPFAAANAGIWENVPYL